MLAVINPDSPEGLLVSALGESSVGNAMDGSADCTVNSGALISDRLLKALTTSFTMVGRGCGASAVIDVDCEGAVADTSMAA